MPVLVNGVELEDAEIERELAHHSGSPEPTRHAVVALILRHLVRAQARRLGLPDSDDEALTQALLEREVGLPEPDEASCRRHYDHHLEHFREGEWVEAEHILFQVTPRVPLDALRATAEATLAQVQADPPAFAGLAIARSNCPTGAGGGRLGRVLRGETAPEFERAIFAARHPGVLARLVETRYGLHVVRVVARCEGVQLPFDAVRQSIARALAAAARDRAWKQYASLLIGGASIEGIDLGGAETPLVQ
ncbi:peptidylprolyl isomerase [Cupriavidus basilensis]|uniref:peptidylprolyl isomerase n=1 Tax=Cupriavidus basilensis TaxID=68895 RepID=A0A0C4Y865_9BURK|nr:peptidylprolyl isomerase [Cupriavidus basilensis]AJG19165.1 Peptidyl-prolyl cis-trans isomerase PpiD [Cupriavidus basilensis]